MSEFKVGSGSPVYQTEAKTKANPVTKLTPAVNTTTNEPVANRTSAYSGRSGGAVATHNASANTQVFGTPAPKAGTQTAAQLIASLPKNQETPAFYTSFSKMIDAAMRKQNVYYDDLIAGKVLRRLVITPVTKNGFQDYMKSIGKLGGQNKIPRLSNDRSLVDLLKTK